MQKESASVVEDGPAVILDDDVGHSAAMVGAASERERIVRLLRVGEGELAKMLVEKWAELEAVGEEPQFALVSHGVASRRRAPAFDPDALLTAQQAALLACVHTNTIYKAAQRGDLPCARIGERGKRFRRDDVLAWGRS